MAILLSHAERTTQLRDLADQVLTVAALSENAERFVTDMMDAGNPASAIETAVANLLTPMGTLRTNIASLLGGLSIVHQVAVKIGMPHNYRFARITASDPRNANYGTIRPPEAYETYVNPFVGIVAGDDVTLSDAEDPDNNGTFRVRITPNVAGGQMLTSSTLDSATGWTESSGDIAITGGEAVFSSATNDVLKQLKANMATPWTDAKAYLVTFEITSYSAGAVNIGTNTTAYQFSANAAGVHEAIIIADAHSDGLVITGVGATLSIGSIAMRPWTGLAFTGGLPADTDEDTSLVITVSER